MVFCLGRVFVFLYFCIFYDANILRFWVFSGVFGCVFGFLVFVFQIVFVYADSSRSGRHDTMETTLDRTE